jgi:hypothetical protein
VLTAGGETKESFVLLICHPCFTHRIDSLAGESRKNRREGRVEREEGACSSPRY